jgi:NADPH-dependent ferric siderophore reductase
MNFSQNPLPNQNFAGLFQANFPTPQNQIANGIPQQNFNTFFPDQNSIQESFAQGQNYEPVKPAKHLVKRTYNMRKSTKAKKQAI